MTDVTLLYVDGCPNWRATDHSLRGLQDELGFRLVRRQVRSAEEAARIGFGGSPTVLVDGTDPFATGEEPDGLACRMYDTPDGLRGSPSLEQLREVLDRPVLRPARHPSRNEDTTSGADERWRI